MASASLGAAALLMGIVGAPHCLAMCGPACAGVVHLARKGHDGVAVLSADSAFQSVPGPRAALASLHGGRLLAYALGGALAASTVRVFEVAGAQSGAARSLWALFHLAVLGWGLSMAITGRQPLWPRAIGRRLSSPLRKLTRTRAGLFATGLLWITMPCGLLYSAWMLASLGNDAFEGALVMLCFALGGSIALVAGPWLWQRLAARRGMGQRTGLRLAGLLLAGFAGYALQGDVVSRIAALCA
ncbi:conserved membrane hypothetical protein [Burkholderiales bacterium 8X]|nr:conserved membrane hypothetical protein [Burkholderiales bacterium 8X]